MITSDTFQLVLADDSTPSAASTAAWILSMGTYVGALVAIIGALIAVVGIILERDYGPDSGHSKMVGITGVVMGILISGLSWAMRSVVGPDEESDDQTTATTTPSPTSGPQDQVDPVNIPWGSIGLGVLIFIAVILLVLAARALWQLRTRRRAAKDKDRQDAAELQGRWERIDERMAKINDVYLTAETDPITVLERPLIRDVSYELTRNFHTALADATAALQRRTDIAYATSKVNDTEAAWASLWSTAGTIGLPGVSPSDRRRARSLLDRILDESVDAPEREAARRKIDDILNSSDLDQDASGAVSASVTQALELAGIDTLPALTRGTDHEGR